VKPTDFLLLDFDRHDDLHELLLATSSEHLPSARASLALTLSLALPARASLALFKLEFELEFDLESACDDWLLLSSTAPTWGSRTTLTDALEAWASECDSFVPVPPE